MGKLNNIPSGWAKVVFTDAENLTEERLDEVLTELLKAFKEGSLENINYNVGVLPVEEGAARVMKLALLPNDGPSGSFFVERTAEALIPLLQLSDSPRIVNVSSFMGKLNNIPSGWAKVVFTDAENLTEERLDEVLTELLKAFKEGSLESKGFPSSLSAYIVSKAALNAYTRILAKKYPTFRINSLCPGFVKTDINYNVGVLPVEEGAARVMKLALLPNDGPSGSFFVEYEVSDF
ncbi:PREDICTED: (+)-neomenthol dehydrogenase [Prunus dulcis]|uniref:PREDICTED: (+)-neomenthol dehydrogenase n=1 Tax=Prunus dulcis TaxID=3755 RepID=A0A5E4EUW6_PRUDU|nr:PREDICTED: (+)-neomenthol dehydrogenase [Prunus dulcis]